MKLIYLIGLLLFSIGCKHDKSTFGKVQPEIIDLSDGLKSDGEIMNISKIARDIQYVFLETTKDCLIDDIDKMMTDKNLIFLFNRRQFFIFNDEGKFVRQIGREGKGPGEYLRIMDFTINPNGQTIFIYDSDQKKVICYKYTGEYISEFKLHSYPTCITNIDSGCLALSWVKPDFIANDYFGISYYSYDGKLLNRTFNRKDENADETKPSTFLTRLNYYGDSLTYWEINLDTIYRIDHSRNMVPRYMIDYQTNTEGKSMDEISKNIFRYSDFLETDDYLFFLGGVYNNKLKHIIFNKKTKECFNLLFKNTTDLNLQIKTGFNNDLDGGYPILPFDILRDGRLYDFFYPYELKNLLTLNALDRMNVINKQKQKVLFDAINNSSEMSNPIIMLVTPK